MPDELEGLQDRSFARAGPAVSSSFPAERRLTGPQLARFLDGHRFAVAATTRPDSRPHAAMTSYFRAGATFWLPTMAGSVRARNVQGRPWLSLVVAEGEGDRHAVVSMEGAAAVVGLDAAPAGLVDRVEDPSWVACWLKLTPSRLFSYAGREATP